MSRENAEGQLQGRMRSIEAAAIAGIVYAALALWAMALFAQVPDLAGSDADLAAWYSAANQRTVSLLGLNLAALSSVAFLWFVAVVRRRIGDREDRFFSTVFLGSAILYVSIWLVAAALLAAPAVALMVEEDGKLTQGAASISVGGAAALILVLAPRMQAVFVLSTSTLIRRTGALPRWVAILGYVIAATLFVVPTLYRFLGVGLPVWVLIVSITILVIRPKG